MHNIPPQYRDLREVFSKTQATCLPPHWPWYCAIDLLSGSISTRGKVYLHSVAETVAMERYIAEALKQGFIRPASPPASVSFFFVSKKGGGLRPCIDYTGLNVITVKYKYSLSSSVLEQLHCAQYFTKLDLQSVDHPRTDRPSHPPDERRSPLPGSSALPDW